MCTQHSVSVTQHWFGPWGSRPFFFSDHAFNFGPFQNRTNVPPLHPNDYYQPFASPDHGHLGAIQSSNASLSSSWISHCSTPSSLRRWVEREYGSLRSFGGYIDEDSRLSSPQRPIHTSSLQFLTETSADLVGRHSLLRRYSLDFHQYQSSAGDTAVIRGDLREGSSRRLPSEQSLEIVEMGEQSNKRRRITTIDVPSNSSLNTEEDP